MERQLRELLTAEASDPPHRVTVEAVRRRALRRWAVQAGAASLAVALAVGAGVGVSAGVFHTGTSPATGTTQHASPPRYYVTQVYSPKAQQLVMAVRDRATGRVTSLVRNPLPHANCGGGNVGVAAADNQTFFMTCTTQRTAHSPTRGLIRRPGKIVSIETRIYRFHVTRSGQATGYTLVRGGVLKGVWTGNIAAAPDGSEVAAEVWRPQSGTIYTNAVPEGIFVINTTTGARALWHTGPYVPGALQYASGQDLSFTRDGRTLVVLESRCPRGRYLAHCNGHAAMQVRAYSPASQGGSLESGQVLLQQSALRPAGTSLVDGFILPDGSAVTALLASCPPHGPCTLSVAQISVGTGRVLRVLYQVHTGSRFAGFFERFFSSDPSGRYLILDAGAGNARVNGWIDHGRLVPLAPADGNAPVYETW
jgi:hypothetical protein